MIAILGGLGAAAAWALSTVCSSRSSRLLDPGSVVGWVMLTGLLIAGPVAVLGGMPAALGGSAGLWLALAGAGNVGGLLLAYAAMRVGQVALIAPVLSTEGAMAAGIAFLAGEAVAPRVGAALAVIVLGISLASVPAAEEQRFGGGHHGRAIALALGAVLAFGSSLYAAGRAGDALPAAWVAAAARLVGVPVLALPLALSGRLRLTRRAVPLVVTAGVCEVLGFYAYTLGARHGIAIAAVLSSQFGTFAAIIGYLVLGERLSRVQVCGVAAVVAGVAALSAFSG
jgi:drug/metabolite transporter (DMT)-like permease